MRHAPTHAARAAQRPGAAAFIMIFPHPREIYALPRDYFASSFFVPRTPARRLRRILWAGGRWRSRPGSAVPHGSGGRTSNPLERRGSAVLFYSALRDARAGMAARVCARAARNHRTIEPLARRRGNQPFLTGAAVLARFRRSGANKQWGGYAALGCASSFGSLQGLNGGSAGGKFWRRVRLAGAIGGAAGEIGGVGESGGFLPFFERASGAVGMRLLERAGKGEADQRLAARRIQPAGLGAIGGLGTPGVAPAGRGGTPPSRAAFCHLPQAQPIFGVSSRLQIRSAIRPGMVRDGRSSLSLPTGSGVEGLSWPLAAARGRAGMSGCQMRVGEDGVSLGRGRSRCAVLCGEGQGVN